MKKENAAVFVHSSPDVEQLCDASLALAQRVQSADVADDMRVNRIALLAVVPRGNVFSLPRAIWFARNNMAQMETERGLADGKVAFELLAGVAYE